MMLLIGLAMFAVLVILGMGLISMASGSAFNTKYANTFMRLRVLFQGITVLLLIVLLLLHI